MSDLMPELILRILMEYEQGRLRSDDITQYVEESIGKEAANKLIKDINKLLSPGIAMLYGGITKSTVPIKYYNRLQNAVLKNSDKIARMNAEVAFLESERMRIDRYLTVKSLVKIRESLLIWKEFLANKEPYTHSVNAMSRYYFPSSRPIGRPPQKKDGQEYKEYKKFLDFIDNGYRLKVSYTEKEIEKDPEKEKKEKTIYKFRPLLRRFIIVFDLLIEYPERRKKAVLDALQMIYYNSDGLIYETWKELEAGQMDLSEAIELIKKSYN